eukprot:1160832-Alexandrium_andersonii.AAC.1
MNKCSCRLARARVCSPRALFELPAPSDATQPSPSSPLSLARLRGVAVCCLARPSAPGLAAPPDSK